MKKHDDEEPEAAPAPEPSETPEPEQDATPQDATPVPVPYPAMRYHADGRSRTVLNELDDDTASAEGFAQKATA